MYDGVFVIFSFLPFFWFIIFVICSIQEFSYDLAFKNVGLNKKSISTCFFLFIRIHNFLNSKKD